MLSPNKELYYGDSMNPHFFVPPGIDYKGRLQAMPGIASPKVLVCPCHKIFYLLRMFVGIIILLIGALFLLKNLDIIQGSFWSWFIPIILIAIGLSMIFKRPHRKIEN